jgi:hypothetical protein
VSTNPAEQRLGYRTRDGRAVSRPTAATYRRVEAALAGELDERELNAEERVQFNVELDSSISEAAHAIAVGRALATRGETTVALNEHGRLMRYFPDGTTTPVE